MTTVKYACPCCGYKTFSEAPGGTYHICEVCFWEDDQIQSNDPDYLGGANRETLRQAQKNFLKFGVSEENMLSHVRMPKEDEARDPDWKPMVELPKRFE